MVKKKAGKKKAARKAPAAWHLQVAYSLGKAAQKVSRKLDSVKGTAKKRVTSRKGRKAATQLSLFDPVAGTANEPLSPVLKEIKAIADISGLTAAIEEMNKISLKHSKHPVMARLVAKVKSLSAVEQEGLSRKFVERLNASLSFNNALYSLPSQVKLSEEDCQKMSAAFIECVAETLEDIGLSEEDRDIFKKMTGDIAEPINELMQFYMHPKTFGQKVKRLWRMQRIIFRMIKIIRMTNALNGQMPIDLMGMPGQKAPPSSNYWVNSAGETNL
ncbi:MAG: hypothetical protein HQL20_02850 [Candidatus Omnitrophica bacterium]|nr:hypothetical protein [Candidatus Omnitrophota bacterium]